MFILEVFWKHSKSIRHVRKTFGMNEKRSESMRLVLSAFGMILYAFRTPGMVIEHDECFPNVFSILSGFFFYLCRRMYTE